MDRGQFLNNYKDAVFIYNCISIDGVFECTELIAQADNTDKYKGQQTTLQKIMLLWVDNETKEKIVKAIEQMAHSHNTIVSHFLVFPNFCKVIFKILEFLCQKLGDKKFQYLVVRQSSKEWPT